MIMMKKIFSFARGRRGQNMVEFAVALPVLCLFLVGVIDFGNVFYRLLLLNEAARASVRAVAVSGDRYTAQAPADAFGTGYNVQVSPPTPMTPSGTVTVTVSKDVYVTPFSQKFFTYHNNYAVHNNQITLTATANMRLEVYPKN